ncbi:MAG TPA: LysR family transcriptional regulator [Candidatus Acidoferrales bacterium]|nr:LysR family transcriptional regulator [Candidatus Acidoferrales bacterium]
MELSELQAFLAVVEEGSFSRAAQRLHRTQPAVSQTIRKLEGDLGEALFDRSSRHGHLTDAGVVLREYAEKLLNLRREVRTALAELRSAERGKLSIAANEFTSLYLLPLLHEFRRACPMVRISITRSLASRVPEAVLNHSVELGMLSFEPEDPALRSVVVATDELAFVVHPRHPLAGARKAGIRELGAQSFVAHHVPSPHRAKVLAAFRRHKTPLNMDVELPTLEAIRKFVAMGNGVALVPAICVQGELARGELVRVPVPELQFERKIRIVYRKKATLSHAGQAFLKVAEALSRRPGSSTLFVRER